MLFSGDGVEEALRWSPEPVFNLDSLQATDDWGTATTHSTAHGSTSQVYSNNSGSNNSGASKGDGSDGDCDHWARDFAVDDDVGRAGSVSATTAARDARQQALQSPRGQQRLGSGKRRLRRKTTRGSPFKSESELSAAADMVSADAEVDLIYDPSLNCYFNPITGVYFQLA